MFASNLFTKSNFFFFSFLTIFVLRFLKLTFPTRRRLPLQIIIFKWLSFSSGKQVWSLHNFLRKMWQEAQAPSVRFFIHPAGHLPAQTRTDRAAFSFQTDAHASFVSFALFAFSRLPLAFKTSLPRLLFHLSLFAHSQSLLSFSTNGESFCLLSDSSKSGHHLLTYFPAMPGIVVVFGRLPIFFSFSFSSSSVFCSGRSMSFAFRYSERRENVQFNVRCCADDSMVRASLKFKNVANHHHHSNHDDWSR